VARGGRAAPVDSRAASRTSLRWVLSDGPQPAEALARNPEYRPSGPVAPV